MIRLFYSPISVAGPAVQVEDLPSQQLGFHAQPGHEAQILIHGMPRASF